MYLRGAVLARGLVVLVKLVALVRLFQEFC